ncbi:hypothetical protein D3C85_1232710 [compost metagenome]
MTFAKIKTLRILLILKANPAFRLQNDLVTQIRSILENLTKHGLGVPSFINISMIEHCNADR